MSEKNDYNKALGEVVNNDTPTINISGWQIINKELLAYKGVYYPQSYNFYVKPFTTKEVIYFTSIDENNPFEIDQAMRYLIDECVQVRDGNKILKTSNVAFNFDRFPLVLLARTYSDMKTDLTFGHKCGKCKKDQTLKIIPQNLIFSDDKIGKYFTKDRFNITVKSDNRAGKSIYGYKPLTIKENQDIFDFIKDKRQDLNDGINQAELKVFAKFRPYLRKHISDNSKMEEIWFTFNDLSKSEIKEIGILSDKYPLDTTSKISVECECGHEEGVQMKFPSGLRAIVIDTIEIDDFLL